MKKLLYSIPFLLLFAASLHAEQTDTTSSNRGFNFDEAIADFTDVPLLLDALYARRSINVSDTGRFSNKPLATFLQFFKTHSSIAVGITQSVDIPESFWNLLRVKEPRGTYTKNLGQHALLFHLNFVPQHGNERFYQIKIDVEKELIAGFENSLRVDTARWPKFNEYIENINNDGKIYARSDFRTAVNQLISKGLFILLGIDDFPLEVAIRPLFARSVDSIIHRNQRNLPFYEWISVAGEDKSVANVALKIGDAMPLQVLVNRMEIDTIEKPVTLSNNRHFNHRLSSFDSVSEFIYTAISKGEDVITATYELQYEERSFTEMAGKLNISVYDERRFKVVLVPVRGSEPTNQRVGEINQREIQQFLNDVYGQAVVQWDVRVDQPLQVNNFNGRLRTETGVLSNYSSDMNSIISAYKNSRTVERETYYIFIVPEFAESSIIGYMPMKRSYGFVAFNANNHNRNSDAFARTIAHELGHGTFRLRHTFSEFPQMPKGSTDNLMDYAISMPQGCGELCISRLFRYQWDFIHNPQGGLYWFQDEEDVMFLNWGRNHGKVVELLKGVSDANVLGIKQIAVFGPGYYYAQNITLENGVRYELIYIEIERGFDFNLIDPSQRNVHYLLNGNAEFVFEVNGKVRLRIRTRSEQLASLEKYLFDLNREQWLRFVARRMYDNGPFHSRPRIYRNKDNTKVRLTRFSSSDRRALNIYKNIFYTLIPYGFALSIVDNLATGCASGIRQDIMDVALSKTTTIFSGALGKYIAGVSSKLLPIYNIAEEMASPENNKERLERLVFLYLANQLRCNENIVNRSLLDCYKRYCAECNFVFMRKYANITYSLFDKIYILNSEADFRRAEAEIKSRRRTLDRIIRFYMSRL